MKKMFLLFFIGLFSSTISAAQTGSAQKPRPRGQFVCAWPCSQNELQERMATACDPNKPFHISAVTTKEGGICTAFCCIAK